MSRLAVLLLALGLCACGENPPPRKSPAGDVEQGKVIVGREACGSCHAIPGLQQSDGLAGPPLTHFASRSVIAGVLPNTGPALIAWLKSPQRYVPGNAMPDMGLSDREAADVAAFLETLK